MSIALTSLIAFALAPLPGLLVSQTEQPSVQAVDVDLDGGIDLWLPDQGRLYWNASSAGLVELTIGLELDSEAELRASAWEDYDSDGDLDLLVAAGKGMWLYEHGPELVFTEVAVERGLVLPEGTPGALEWIRTDATRPTLVVSGSFGVCLAVPVGRNGFAGVSMPAVRVSGTQLLRVAAGSCAKSIANQAGGGCIEASSSPELGMLYPLSEDWFVLPEGRVGIGTTVPGEQLSVAGLVESLSSSVQFLVDASIQNATIDNENYVYFAIAEFDYVLPTTDLRLFHLQQEYTVDGPLP